MKKVTSSFLILLFVMLLGGAKTAHTAETIFFDTLYDIPVMTGLTEIPEMSGSFDKVQGRIAYATASIENLQQDEILSFYNKVLPQMGWARNKSGMFVRDSESLDISFDTAYDIKLIRFAIRPEK